MKGTSKTLLAFKFLLVFVATCLGWEPAAAQVGTVYDEAAGDEWRSALILYAWGLGMDGTATIRGNEVEVDKSFSDLLDDLDAALSLRFEAHKGRWGFFLDGMYTRLKPEEDTPIGTVTVDVKSWIAEAGGLYHFNDTVAALYGVRYQDMDVNLEFPRRTVGAKQDWVDGFVGLRLVPVRTEKWAVFLRADVGGGDSDFVWNASLGAQYRFNRNWSAIAAYRVLANDVEKDGFRWDVNYQGLGLAVGYSF